MAGGQRCSAAGTDVEYHHLMFDHGVDLLLIIV